MAKILIIIGVLFILAGVIIHFAGKSSFLGNLPGDFKFEKGNTRIYIPLATSLIISVLLSVLLFIFQKLKS